MRIIFLALLIILALLAGLFLKAYPGSVVISLPHWQIIAPIWLAILFTLIGFMALHYLIRLGLFFRRLPTYFKKRRALKKALRIFKYSKIALHAFIKNDWGKAEKYFILAADESNEFPEARIMAAKALARRNESEKFFGQIIKIKKQSVDSKHLVDFVAAEHYFKAGQNDLTIKTLDHLEKTPQVLMLLYAAYLKSMNWKKLTELLPLIQKQKLIAKDKVANIEEEIYSSLLEDSNNNFDLAEKLWDKMPCHLQKNQKILATYARTALNHGQNELVYKPVYKSIEKKWNDDLVEIFAQIIADDKKSLKIAEGWLKDHPNNAVLFTALGQICIREKLWGKAETYFKSAIEILPTKKAYRLLGAVFERKGEKQNAFEIYKKAVEE